MPAKKKAAAKKPAKKAVKKTVAKKPVKKVVKKTVAKKPVKKAKRVPNPAFMKPMTPSADLAEVVGNKPMPRTQITKKLWEYIKKYGLQDKNQKTMINADDKLKRVFGGKGQVSMFEMTKLVSKHLS
jgi:upstream activation factor subunit UAF30